MASLTIRNLDENLKSLLRLQAARHNCSMEQEARAILRQGVQASVPSSNFAERINQRFAALDTEELTIPPRSTARLPPLSED
jgi:plasmid stability protein